MNRTHKRWWRRPSRLIPLASILLALIALLGFIWASRSGLQNEIDSIRARGLPTTPAELDAWYKHVPPDENMAEAILDAHGKFVLPAEGRNPDHTFSWRDIRMSEPFPPIMAAMATDYVAKNADTIQLLHAAAELERSRYPVDLSKAPYYTASHRIAIRSMVQLLRWDALLNAEKGDSAGALQSLKAGFALAASLRDEPLMVSVLIGIACLQIHMDAVEKVVNRANLDEAQLKELAAVALRAEEKGKSGFQKMVIAERALGMSYFNSMAFGDFEQLGGLGELPVGYDKLPEPVRVALFRMWQGFGFQDQEAAFLVRSMGEWERTTGLKDAEMWRESERYGRGVKKEMEDHPARYIIASVLVPDMALMTRKEALAAARLRCLCAAIAVERFRKINGGEVPAIQKLVPEFIEAWPRDPVDDRALELEARAEGGFRVWAKAASLLANEGRTTTSTNWQDVAFTLVR